MATFPIGELLAQENKENKDLIKQQEATKYLNEEIKSRLDRLLSDCTHIPGIDNRFKKIVHAWSGSYAKISYGAVGMDSNGPHHHHNKKALAELNYDLTGKRPFLLIFVPALRKQMEQWQKAGFNEREIDLMLAIIYAHEQIHYEKSEVEQKYPPLATRIGNKDLDPNLPVDEEAEAWGITILEMIRPALSNGMRLPENMTALSLAFKKAGDDYNSPEWKYVIKNAK